MTWPAQVWHVFRKDVREHWMMGLIVMSITAALAYAGVGRFNPNDLPIVLASSSLPIALFVYMTRPVSVEQPARHDLFWATQPLRPDAVATAKLLHLLFVLTLIAGISALVCLLWSVDGAAIPRLVGVRTWMLVCIGLVAAHVAAITSDRSRAAFLRSRIVLLVIVVAVPLLIINSGNPRPQQFVNVIPTFVYPLAAVAAAALFIRSYQQRERSLATSGASVACCLLLIAGVFRDPLMSRVTATGTIDTSNVSFKAKLQRTGGVQMDVALANDEPGTVPALAHATITAILRDGSRVSAPVSLRRLNRTSTGTDSRTVDPTLRFITANGSATAAPSDVRQREIFAHDMVFLPRKQASPSNVTRLILDGAIETHLLHEIARYPARSNAQPRIKGAEIEIESDLIATDSAGPWLEVRRRQLPLAKQLSVWPAEYWNGGLGVSFALIDSVGRTLLPMATEESSNSGGPPNLLGFNTERAVYRLRPLKWNLSTPPVDSAWLANAYLIVAVPRLLRSQGFHAEVAVP